MFADGDGVVLYSKTFLLNSSNFIGEAAHCYPDWSVNQWFHDLTNDCEPALKKLYAAGMG
jgi:hypothetical protein